MHRLSGTPRHSGRHMATLGPGLALSLLRCPGGQPAASLPGIFKGWGTGGPRSQPCQAKSGAENPGTPVAVLGGEVQDSSHHTRRGGCRHPMWPWSSWNPKKLSDSCAIPCDSSPWLIKPRCSLLSQLALCLGGTGHPYIGAHDDSWVQLPQAPMHGHLPHSHPRITCPRENGGTHGWTGPQRWSCCCP